MALNLRAVTPVDVGPEFSGAVNVPQGTAVVTPIPVPIVQPFPRRVKDADINEISTWLIPRLMDKHPNAQGEGILSLMRHATLGGQLFLVRTQNVVALAEAYRTELEAKVCVRERWLRCNRILKNYHGREVLELTPELKKEAALVQAAEIAWAQSSNACRIILGEDTDLPSSEKYEADSRLRQRPVFVLDFGAPAQEKAP